MGPGTVFTKLHSRHNLRMAQYAMCYITLALEGFATDKHSSLLGPFVSYEENEVL